MSKEESDAQKKAEVEDDDEPDEWDKRIFSTGCAGDAVVALPYPCLSGLDENAKMTDCYFEKKDWRACAAEMEEFKQCWKAHNNDKRTETKDN
ncbi:hypothetical protein NM208_g15723 [Fusarium decemcellulare]|uniref:Uncharacterized protein n=1 Tax=Fusarium decemcellulare TaxID=57161 RepID=A0ACC1RET6_9HYPO|nr:hypothetical protein NM208_g15723 [Fusarium decemcellulare]